MGELAMGSDAQQPKEELLSGRKLFGSKVENPRGEGLGKLEDLMVSADEGRIAYAVVSFGGVLRLGNKLFAFPWSSLHVDHPGKKVILNMDKSALAKAHGFDKDHWPDTSSWNWGPAVRVAAPAPERAAVTGSPENAPVPGEPVPVEGSTSAGNRMEHWGESWQSHGLDRS